MNTFPCVYVVGTDAVNVSIRLLTFEPGEERYRRRGSTEPGQRTTVERNVWTYHEGLYCSQWRQRAIALIKLDQILEDQLSPSGTARLDEQTALGELAEIDGREAELFNQGRYLRGRVLVVARQESDPPPALDVWVLR